MATERKDPSVTVPSEGQDRPRLARVGVVAAVCFVVGMVWPTLAGVRLVPEPPTKESDKPSKAAPRPKHAPTTESTAEVPAMKLEATAVEKPQVQIDDALIVNCRDKDDRRLSECDKPDFDSVANGRLMALLGCEAAGNPEGMLSIGFDLDFRAKKIQRILRGKSTTLDDATADALIDCAKREFMTATLEGVAHTHARYLVFYGVQFAAKTESGQPIEQGEPVVETTGKATVIWNSARLRERPEDGEVKATLMYGAQVVVTGRQGDWYRVKYDAKGNEAWVHKNALAL